MFNYLYYVKQINYSMNRRHFETGFNIPGVSQGIRYDIPVLINQSNCRDSLDTLLQQNIRPEPIIYLTMSFSRALISNSKCKKLKMCLGYIIKL